MAQLEGVLIEKLQGGLNRLAQSTDDHLAMIITIPDTDKEIAKAIHNNGKGVVLNSVYAAKELGLNESFDANHKLQVFNQIEEFFRLSPAATLYLFNNAAIKELGEFLNKNKEVKGYATNVAYTAAEPNLIKVIGEHQTMINSFAAQNRLIDFCILGFDGLDDFKTDLLKLSAPNVSVCIACETDKKVVSIGSVLGMLAARQINENIGSVNIINKPRAFRGTPDYSLTNALSKRWVNAYITTGASVESLDNTLLKEIINKGYMVAASYEGYAGYFFTNSATCIERASDFAYIENNRTWNKAARVIRTTLLPEVRGVVKKNPTTGFIAATTVSRWQGLINKNLEQMVSQNEISGFEVYIDAKQIVNATTPVKIKAMIVADGIVHEFDVAVGLTNNI